ERAIAAHAAHALRTPLAGLSAQLAVAQREAAPAQQPPLQRARQAAERLRRVVGALITLFRAGAVPALQPLDLAALVQSLPIERLQLAFEGESAVQADPDLLAAALLNLLDNSLRHGASRVRVSCRHRAGQALIRVEDDGPGASAERRAALRAALSQQAPGAEGIGLGLLLADQVARAHGGTLVLLDTEPGFGLELQLGAPAPSA
ncbi:MAG: HAMP domain-containing histidine kinase, partial [Burkholderiales bacterium]|nr:HAMP domain-containing histidine kinase [Burkholderiales bacterium]